MVQNVLLVPVEALHETAPGKYSVYVVQNGTLTQRQVEIGLQDQAFAEVHAILAAERLKRERQIGLSDFVRRLQAEL